MTKPRTTPARRIAERVEASDLADYSIRRAIRTAMGDLKGPSLERDVSDAIGGSEFAIPTNLPMAAALNSSVTNRGAEMVFQYERPEFVDVLRAARPVTARATWLTGLTSGVAIPKQSAAGSFYWVDEEPGSDVTESNITTEDAITLSPKTIAGTMATTRQLVALSSGGPRAGRSDRVVENDLVQGAAGMLELAAINGSGTGNEPEGILNTTGVGDVAGGANGAAPDYQDIVDLEYAVAVDDVDEASTAYITTPGVRKVLRTTEKASGSGVVWEGSEMLGHPARVSTAVPSNLTKGTGTNLHAILYGAWSNLFIGEWGRIEIMYDPYAQKMQGILELTLFYTVDVGVRYPEAFAAMQDAVA